MRWNPPPPTHLRPEPPPPPPPPPPAAPLYVIEVVPKGCTIIRQTAGRSIAQVVRDCFGFGHFSSIRSAPDLAAMTDEEFRQWLRTLRDGDGNPIFRRFSGRRGSTTIFAGHPTNMTDLRHAMIAEQWRCKGETLPQYAPMRRADDAGGNVSTKPFLRERRYLFGFIPFGWKAAR